MPPAPTPYLCAYEDFSDVAFLDSLQGSVHELAVYMLAFQGAQFDSSPHRISKTFLSSWVVDGLQLMSSVDFQSSLQQLTAEYGAYQELPVEISETGSCATPLPPPPPAEQELEGDVTYAFSNTFSMFLTSLQESALTARDERAMKKTGMGILAYKKYLMKLFEPLNEAVGATFSKRAFIQWYTGEGMEELFDDDAFIELKALELLWEPVEMEP